MEMKETKYPSALSQSKYESHSSRVCNYISSKLASMGIRISERYSNFAKEQYRVRGKLMHDGDARGADADELSKLVRQILLIELGSTEVILD